MSKFETKVCRIGSVVKHPNADTLYICKINDWTTITNRSDRFVGELVVYIPEGSILPEWMLKRLEFWNAETNKGILAGSDGNRLKAMKLRGVLSQGVMFPVEINLDNTDPYNTVVTHYIRTENVRVQVSEGDDVHEALGVTKYEPPIPIHMQGEVWNAFGHTVKYDIENLKNYPNVLVEDDEVVVTEKLHGTFCAIGYDPAVEDPEHPFVIHTKNMGHDGLAFKVNDANKGNLYVTAFLNHWEQFSRIRHAGQPVFVLGEIFGAGVQDLHYGQPTPVFRVFDVYYPSSREYFSYDAKVDFCNELGFKMVPHLYRGPYSNEKIQELTNGKETLSGKSANVREGVVVTPTKERHDLNLGRVILKSVSEGYLLRKNKDATEYT
jgi:RNA ligase (TIGR02306 family)